MPFSLGFWAAAGAGGAAAGAFEQISTTLLTGNAASVTFSSIPSTYKHLQIRVTMHADSTFDGALQLFMRLNNDSGANYAAHGLRGDGSSVGVENYSPSYNEIRTGSSTIITNYSGQVTQAFSPGIIDLLDYASTNKNKTVRMLLGNYGATSFGKAVFLMSGLWNSTSAVNSIYLAPQYGNFVSGSRFSLYGIKG